MNLIDGLILHTLTNPNGVSQHSMLMRFYELDDKIHNVYDTMTLKERFHSLTLYFMQIEAFSILKQLGIM